MHWKLERSTFFFIFSSIHDHLKQRGENTGGGGFNPTRFSDFPDGNRLQPAQVKAVFLPGGADNLAGMRPFKTELKTPQFKALF